MRLNIFKPLVVLFLLASLFLPWISSTMFLSTFNSHVVAQTVDFSPLLIRFANTYQYDGEIETRKSSDSFFEMLHPLTLISLFHLDVSIEHKMISLSIFIYVFSVFFTILGLLATSIWKMAIRKIHLITACMLVLGASFYLVVLVGVHNRNFIVWAPYYVNYNGGGFYLNPISFGSGIISMLLSLVFFLASYFHPRFVNLPYIHSLQIIQLDRIKKRWLVVPEKEELPLILLTTLLVTWCVGFFASNWNTLLHLTS